LLVHPARWRRARWQSNGENTPQTDAISPARDPVNLDQNRRIIITGTPLHELPLQVAYIS